MIPVPLLPRWLRYTAVGVVATVIFYGSLVTVPETAVDDAQPDGLGIQLSYWRHLVAYATLACAIAYATDHWELPRWHHAAIVIGLAAGYGIAMEFGQALLPHRTPFLLTDAVVNTIGASLVLGWFLVRPYFDLTPLPELYRQIRDTPD